MAKSMVETKLSDYWAQYRFPESNCKARDSLVIADMSCNAIDRAITTSDNKDYLSSASTVKVTPTSTDYKIFFTTNIQFAYGVTICYVAEVSKPFIHNEDIEFTAILIKNMVEYRLSKYRA